MTQTATTFALNNHVRRQLDPASKYSHYEGHEAFLLGMIEREFNCGTVEQGYRDGVVLVTLPASGFYCGVVQVTPETKLRATFSARNDNERPFISVEAIGAEKLPASHVQAVLYRKDVLAETNDNSTDATWELVSINARYTCAPEPMTPMAMARNMSGQAGGTKAEYTAQQFVESILYWSDKAMAGK
jgi:hypothetical protein